MQTRVFMTRGACEFDMLGLGQFFRTVERTRMRNLVMKECLQSKIHQISGTSQVCSKVKLICRKVRARVRLKDK